MTVFQPRVTGRVNWYGLWTLYLKEVRHFLKLPTHTVLAPTITGLLFLAVFTLALGGTVREVAGSPFVEFLAPGLVIMLIVHASFDNPAASIVQGKLQGSIVDVLMPPLSPAEFTFGYVLGGATRGLLVGATLLILMQVFVQTVPRHPEIALFHAVGTALALAMLGLIAGLWAPKWDHLAMVNNFTITPLAFLSGVFYSIENLPGAWREVARLNPFFYMIDGFRYGFIGRADGSLATGLVVVVALNVALWLLCHRLIVSGYNLKP